MYFQRQLIEDEIQRRQEALRNESKKKWDGNRQVISVFEQTFNTHSLDFYYPTWYLITSRIIIIFLSFIFYLVPLKTFLMIFVINLLRNHQDWIIFFLCLNFSSLFDTFDHLEFFLLCQMQVFIKFHGLIFTRKTFIKRQQ